MITIEVTSVNIAYSKGTVSGVNVNFFATHEHQTINLNGYIPLTFEEYTPIANDISGLQAKVKDKVVTALTGTETEAE
ncbi:Uncharacterised protein [Niallia circulans]|uniref:hypothetical protein n=1 Tax=Niallia circulans TaxID=1397 RepID=UPI00077CCEDF|nr:hypothetical protein [Niallia circulans]MDR4314979.1 hypothetical protein [Niallia circulans]MED3837704.1 hypothetical protein [Niallia circulans]MED4243150.1 hypothetical protein [Niallia circulans]MED4247129.1 hypothetical protein [Niallia circulans]QKH61669.1 hypothetical protein FOC77_13920 [Niallia circulans]